MPEFLELLQPKDALDILRENLSGFSLESEIIKSVDAQNRVLANDILSDEDVPSFTRSTVDGFAVKSKDTFGSSDVLPSFFEVIGEIKMGQAASLEIQKGQACLIHTGGMLPVGADAVVMIENTQYSSSHEIEVYKSVPPGENIILKGEDIKIGQPVLSAGKVIRSAEIGGLVALGITSIEVKKLPSIGIISTGDEVISPEQTPQVGQVRDINSYILKAIADKYGANTKNYPIVKDNKDELVKSLKLAYSENDVIIVTAGSSASVRDLTADSINELGKPGVLVHGINVKPGKPTILAVVDNKPIIGLPGNPVSAFVIAHMILDNIMPFIKGERIGRVTPSINALLTINVASLAGREDWIPVKYIGEDRNGRILVEPIFYKSNLIFSLFSAFGFARIDPDVTGLDANAEVEVIKI